MKVILTKDVDALGDSGDVLAVADGYARNYLFPKKLAIVATEGSMKDLQARIERIRAKAEKKQKEDQHKADIVTAIETIALEANASDTGKLYGAITTKELSRILHEKSGLLVERKQLNVNAPINRVGEYTLYVKFSSKVSASVAVVVRPIASAEPPAPALYNEADYADQDDDR
ncbi:MAG: 50S ribosomal protein L9 [Vampirovibrionales bacterium]|nr:50S ribosomal protein L9 [Vampirovibrionales bacterium]